MHSGEALGAGIDHRAEDILPQGPLLLKSDSDGRQVVVGQGLAQQVVAGLGADRGRLAECGVFRRGEGMSLGEGRSDWRSAIMARCWYIRQVGADRVELDIPVTVQQVAFAVDQIGFVADFPACAATRLSLPIVVVQNAWRSICFRTGKYAAEYHTGRTVVVWLSPQDRLRRSTPIAFWDKSTHRNRRVSIVSK